MRDRLLSARFRSGSQAAPSPPITRVTSLSLGNPPPPLFSKRALPHNQRKRPTQLALQDLEERDISNHMPLQTKRDQATTQTTPNRATSDSLFFNGRSIFDTNDGDACGKYIQGIATSADRRAMSNQNYEAKLKVFTLHQAKATAALSNLMSELQARPPASVLTELEDMKREMTTARSKEKELEATVSRLEATISKLTYKNKVSSTRCASFESQLVALEAENQKTKEELKIAVEKYSGAKATGYAKGLKKFPSTEQGRAFLQKFWEEEKAKWLKSVDFLDHLTEGALQYFDYGFDSCQKQAEQQGFVGQLNKDAALQEAPELKGWESGDCRSK